MLFTRADESRLEFLQRKQQEEALSSASTLSSTSSFNDNASHCSGKGIAAMTEEEHRELRLLEVKYEHFISEGMQVLSKMAKNPSGYYEGGGGGGSSSSSKMNKILAAGGVISGGRLKAVCDSLPSLNTQSSSTGMYVAMIVVSLVLFWVALKRYTFSEVLLAATESEEARAAAVIILNQRQQSAGGGGGEGDHADAPVTVRLHMEAALARAVEGAMGFACSAVWLTVGHGWLRPCWTAMRAATTSALIFAIVGTVWRYGGGDSEGGYGALYLFCETVLLLLLIRLSVVHLKQRIGDGHSYPAASSSML